MLDLRRVEFIDSTGLRALIAADERARSDGPAPGGRSRPKRRRAPAGGHPARSTPRASSTTRTPSAPERLAPSVSAEDQAEQLAVLGALHPALLGEPLEHRRQVAQRGSFEDPRAPAVLEAARRGPRAVPGGRSMPSWILLAEDQRLARAPRCESVTSCASEMPSSENSARAASIAITRPSTGAAKGPGRDGDRKLARGWADLTLVRAVADRTPRRGRRRRRSSSEPWCPRPCRRGTRRGR